MIIIYLEFSWELEPRNGLFFSQLGIPVSHGRAYRDPKQRSNYHLTKPKASLVFGLQGDPSKKLDDRPWD